MAVTAYDQHTETTRCVYEPCTATWRHTPDQDDAAQDWLARHLHHCPLNKPCPKCHAAIGQSCVTRNNTTTHRPHNARRSAA